MKKIVIRQICLLNFKGIRNLTINFDDYETNIFGANGTGKTTVFDSFTWLLFGKDSKDRKDFNIKTLDENNKPIERIPHEVSATIEVNGEEITLRKCYNENWTKKRGSAVETFNGHSVECYYNDVPCSVTEYTKKIADICDEKVFKLITSPTFFTSQKKEFQRGMLFQLAGDVTNDDVLQSYPQFADLVAKMSGKTLDELKREVASKKRIIKDNSDNIPARIDERKRDIPEERDWSALQEEIDKCRKDIAEIDEQMADRSKAYNEVTKEKQRVAKELSDVRVKISARESELNTELLSDYRNAVNEHNKAVNRISTLENDRRYKNISLQRAKNELQALNDRREVLVKEWRSIKNEEFVVDENKLVCPTCHRQFEAEDVNAKIAQMQSDFNSHKAARLEANKSKGLEVKAGIEAKEKEISLIENEIFDIDSEIEKVKASSAYNHEPVAPETASAISSDKTIIELKNRETDLRNQLETEVQAPDTSDLKDKRRQLESIIQQNTIALDGKQRIENNKKRIEELENEYRKCQEQLAELEGVEFEIQQFSKARIEQVESRINGLFRIVKFKMFEQQINGGEIETCEAMVNGVPFSDLNDAMKINAGLDIINAISNANGISAPIFIDNRESVTEIVSVMSQVINLVVDRNCKTLKID
mgnify:FL=1